jgi:hypothetical protein
MTSGRNHLAITGTGPAGPGRAVLWVPGRAPDVTEYPAI